MNDIKRGITYLEQKGVNINPVRTTLGSLTDTALKHKLREVFGEDLKIPRKKAEKIDLLVIFTHRKGFTINQRKRLTTLSDALAQ